MTYSIGLVEGFGAVVQPLAVGTPDYSGGKQARRDPLLAARGSGVH